MPVAVAGLPDAPVVPGTPGYKEAALEGPAYPTMPKSVSSPNLDPPPMPDSLKNPFAAGEAAAALAPPATSPLAMPLSVSSPAEVRPIPNPSPNPNLNLNPNPHPSPTPNPNPNPHPNQAAKAVADQHAADAAKALEAAKKAMDEANAFAASAAKSLEDEKKNGVPQPSPDADPADVGNVMVAANDAARKALEAGIKATRREGLKSAAGYIKAAEEAKAKAQEAQAATAEATQAAQAHDSPNPSPSPDPNPSLLLTLSHPNPNP